jgi:acylphosphatase
VVRLADQTGRRRPGIGNPERGVPPLTGERAIGMSIRVRFFFEGMVQGVGFRPFVWRQAHARSLAGFVRNRPDGVVAEVEGEAASVEGFLAGVKEQLPPLAEIIRVTQTPATV